MVAIGPLFKVKITRNVNYPISQNGDSSKDHQQFKSGLVSMHQTFQNSVGSQMTKEEIGTRV